MQDVHELGAFCETVFAGLDEGVDVALRPGGGDVGVVEEHGAVVFPSDESRLESVGVRCDVHEFVYCFLLCCVAVTAPAFADFSHFEALERFFVEVVAFRVIAQSIVWKVSWAGWAVW